MADWLDAMGLLCGILGALLLYLFGVPRHPERSRAGQSYLRLEQDNEFERGRVLQAAEFGKLGLGLIILAFVLQFASLCVPG